ncbi:unnamed protein product [Protopolystoma xenopodis]|uniref:Uncharacterized protein n=1 Tax=Protopolystoma xenopodis TaxID=117903 RepID=A0A3S4ZXX3_9PLAT|nr:unnamed protein product [Protopolystoma xenopodis]
MELNDAELYSPLEGDSTGSTNLRYGITFSTSPVPELFVLADFDAEASHKASFLAAFHSTSVQVPVNLDEADFAL